MKITSDNDGTQGPLLLTILLGCIAVLAATGSGYLTLGSFVDYFLLRKSPSPFAGLFSAFSLDLLILTGPFTLAFSILGLSLILRKARGLALVSSAVICILILSAMFSRLSESGFKTIAQATGNKDLGVLYDYFLFIVGFFFSLFTFWWCTRKSVRGLF